MTASPTPARPAATVVVVRPAAAHPFEVLLVRRNDSVAFMAGAHVFPGGRVDAADAAEPPGSCDGLDALGRCVDLAPVEEARYRIAAIRELLEEAGVLLARRAGAFVDRPTADLIRTGLGDRAPLVASLASHGLRAALDAVVPFAHWVTPEIETRRFDTRFLLARMPDAQEATHDGGETTALDWLSPIDALTRAGRGELKLPPPTWTTLQQLQAFSSIDDAWHWASTAPIARIQPGFFQEDGRTVLTLPGDPTYPPPPGVAPLAITRFELLADHGWRPLRG
ncbi:MAG: NUDIX domain-containing protein [Vicinamibacterales bacterium]